MKVTIDFSAHIKQKCNSPVYVLETEENLSVQELLRSLAKQQGELFHRFLFDHANNLKPIILLSVNDQQVAWHQNHFLQDGDRIAIFSPIAGG
jgi:molybdopterin converting factor small subunit